MEANEQRLHFQEIYESPIDKYLEYYDIYEQSESDEKDFRSDDGESIEDELV